MSSVALLDTLLVFQVQLTCGIGIGVRFRFRAVVAVNTDAFPGEMFQRNDVRERSTTCLALQTTRGRR